MTAEILQQEKLWAVYKTDVDNGQRTVYIINPENGERIPVGSMPVLVTYEQAMKAVEEFNLDGTYFMLTEGNTMLNIVNAFVDNTLNPLAEEIISLLNSYTEYDPNSNNITIIFKCGLGRINFRRQPYDNKIFILICNERFTPFTFNPYGDERPVRECSDDEVKALIDKYIYGGLIWCNFGSHRKCDIAEGLALWCFAQKNNLFMPFVVSLGLSNDISWVKNALPLAVTMETCIKWRDELKKFNYDVQKWKENWKATNAVPPEPPVSHVLMRKKHKNNS